MTQDEAKACWDQVTYIHENRVRMAEALAARGWDVNRNTPLDRVADAVTKAVSEPLESYGCAVTVHVSADPAAFLPSPEQAALLLDGATVQVVAGLNSYTAPLTSLEPGTAVSFSFPLLAAAPAIIRLRLNPEALRGTGINAPEIRTTLAPGSWAFAVNLVKTEAPAYSEIGFRVFDDMSFSEVQDLLLDVSPGGVVSEADTGYLDAQTGKWVSTSPLERGCPQVSSATGEIVAWHKTRQALRNDLFGIAAPNEKKPAGVWPFNAIRSHVYTAQAADGTMVTNRLIGIGDNGTDIPHWFLKVQHVTAILKTRQTNGEFTESSQNVTEYFFAETQLDAGYRRVEIDYLGQYHNSRKTLSMDGASKSVEFSDATGYGPDIGIQRFKHQENTERVNLLAGATFDGRPLPQVPRQVSMFSYHALSCLWPLVMMACGSRNCQSYIQGHTAPYTDEGPDSERAIGCTKCITDLGLPIGTLRNPDVASSFVLFGMENLWGSIGTFLADVTNVGGRFFYQPDRRYWLTDMTPQVIDGVTVSADTLLRHYGYRELSVVPVAGYIRALREDDQDPDILVPTSPAVSSLPASSGTGYADYVYLGYDSGASYLVAAGYYRSLGFQLGAFCLVAYNSWANSVGPYYSARVSLRKLSTAVQGGAQTAQPAAL